MNMDPKLQATFDILTARQNQLDFKEQVARQNALICDLKDELARERDMRIRLEKSLVDANESAILLSKNLSISDMKLHDLLQQMLHAANQIVLLAKENDDLKKQIKTHAQFQLRREDDTLINADFKELIVTSKKKIQALNDEIEHWTNTIVTIENHLKDTSSEKNTISKQLATVTQERDSLRVE